MQAVQILVIDDDPILRDLLQTQLQKFGFQAVVANDSTEAEQRINESIPDLIILDWKLPGMNGLEYAGKLKRRSKTRAVPIIMLSGKCHEKAKVAGLECGADDYVTKPYSIKELVARIKLRLKQREHANNNKPIEINGLRLEPANQRVCVNGINLELDQLEFNLLHFFMRHPEQVLSRQQLLVNVWGSDLHVDERTIDVYIRRLRKALQPSGQRDMLQTVRGSGYRLSADG